ncbi:MAG: glycosyltransferase, partial [Phycisphaerae bacterium]|nr:glycosyltransferase [Phycisphaerae bacterium]
MKIHLYLKDFRPTEKAESGMEKAIAGLAAGLAANGIEANLLCESDADLTIPSPDGYTIRSFKNVLKRRHLHLAPGLQEYARAQIGKDSLVILNAIFHPSVARFAALLRRLKRPYVISPHDPYHPTIFIKNAKMKWPYWYFVERPMLRKAAAVQVLDPRHEQYLADRGVQTKVIAVGLGVTPHEVPPPSSISFNGEGPAKLLFLGRIETINKGLDLLIDAFDGVASQHDAVLTIQGPNLGDLDLLKAKAARKFASSRITFLPPDFTATASQIIARHDLFVLPSRFEGFSFAAMEAMLAARPVIITDIAGLSPHIRAANAGM